MITKGHDVAGVTLVGVILADLSLNLPDFRAAERTFQLLCQVAGRAGRGKEPGRVIIQTYLPDHYSFQFAVAHDYEGFFASEVEFRRALNYPPFSRLVHLRFEGINLQEVEQKAKIAGLKLKRRQGDGEGAARIPPTRGERTEKYRRPSILHGQLFLSSAEGGTTGKPCSWTAEPDFPKPSWICELSSVLSLWFCPALSPLQYQSYSSPEGPGTILSSLRLPKSGR